MRTLFAAWAAAILLGSCAKPSETPPPSELSALDKDLIKIAGEYVRYGRVDDANRWSPTLCAFRPSHAAFSSSRDDATHGRKIYYIFARDRRAYIDGIKESQPDGQVIV